MIKNVVENENVYLAELRFPSQWNSADMNKPIIQCFRVILPQIELSSIKLN